jgi:hypothetical protein
LFPADDNDENGDAEMNRVENDDDVENNQVEVPIVRRESSVKLVFRSFSKED